MAGTHRRRQTFSARPRSASGLSGRATAAERGKSQPPAFANQQTADDATGVDHATACVQK